MSQSSFIFGAPVHCEGSECGRLRRVVIASDAEAITHLVVEPSRPRMTSKLVPIELVEKTDPEKIGLRCTLAEFEALENARVLDARSELSADYESEAASVQPVGPRGLHFGQDALNPDGLPGPNVDGTWTGLRKERRRFAEDNLPAGEGEVWQGQHVHASDGPIGHVRGVIADSSDHEVSYVLLDEGHLWGRKEVAIPKEAVKFVVDDGVHLGITKEQVGDLPPSDLVRSE